jgi:hypothetical protein
MDTKVANQGRLSQLIMKRMGCNTPIKVTFYLEDSLFN